MNNCPLTEYPVGYHQGTELFQTTELSGVPPRPKTVPSKYWETYKLVSSSALVAWFHLTHAFKSKTRSCRLLKFNWWNLLVILAKVKLPSFFRANSLAVGGLCGYKNDPLVHMTESLDWVPCTNAPPYLEYPPDIIKYYRERYISPSTNTCMVKQVDKTRVFLNLIAITYTNSYILLNWGTEYWNTPPCCYFHALEPRADEYEKHLKMDIFWNIL